MAKGLGFLKGFRDFILRGNIIDLAVAVVIGVAFNDLVNKLTDDLIKPLIGLFGGNKTLAGSFTFHHQTFQWADFINAIIKFIIVAAVVYFFIVKPMNMLMTRVRRGEEQPPPAPPTDETKVLREIRDILLAQNGRGDGIPAQASVGSEARPATDKPAAAEG